MKLLNNVAHHITQTIPFTYWNYYNFNNERNHHYTR